MSPWQKRNIKNINMILFACLGLITAHLHVTVTISVPMY